MTKQLGQYLRTFLVLAVTAGIFYALFSRISPSSVATTLIDANPWYLLLALLIHFCCLIIGTKRWQVVLRAMGYSISYKDCMYMIMGALPLSSITPAKSGDLIKSYYLKDRIPITKTAGSVLAERVFDVLILIVFSLVGLLTCRRFELAGIVFAFLAAIVVFFFVSHIEISFPIKQSWNDKLHNLLLAMKTLTKDRKRFLAVLAYTFATWFLSIVQTMVFFWALGIHVPFFLMMANIPIAIFIGMIPVTLGGMGTRDSAIIYLFADYAEPAQLFGVGILFSFFRYWLLSIIGIPFMRRLMKQG